MNPIDGHVGRLVGKPDAFPFVADLPEVFRLVQQFLGSTVRVAAVDRNEAADIAESHRCHQSQQEQAPHGEPPCPVSSATADGTRRTCLRILHADEIPPAPSMPKAGWSSCPA